MEKHISKLSENAAKAKSVTTVLNVVLTENIDTEVGGGGCRQCLGATQPWP